MQVMTVETYSDFRYPRTVPVRHVVPFDEELSLSVKLQTQVITCSQLYSVKRRACKIQLPLNITCDLYRYISLNRAMCVCPPHLNIACDIYTYISLNRAMCVVQLILGILHSGRLLPSPSQDLLNFAL